MIEHDVNGWIIDSEDPRAMASCLETALTHPERIVELGEAGYDTVEGEYLFSKQAEILEGTYRSHCSLGGPSNSSSSTE